MQPSASADNKKQKLLVIISVAAVLVIGLLVLLQNQTTGRITIKPAGQQAQVFVDKKAKAVLLQASSTTIKTSSGEHEVLVSSDDTYPWREMVSVSGGATETIRPFLIPQTTNRLQEVPQAVQAALREIRSQSVATADQPATSTDNSTRLFVDKGSNLIAQWAKSTTTAPEYFNCHQGTCGVSVYQSDNQEITQVAFYPQRSDVAVFATGRGVFAIEIDPTGQTQNFQPIADGVRNPHFFINRDNQIIIQSDNQMTVTQL